MNLVAFIAECPTLENPADTDAAAPKDAFFAVPISSITRKEVHWLWKDRIPLGKLTVLAGDPKLGKSLLALDIAARVSAGTDFPDGSRPPVGAVLIISAENDAADTIRPRLEVAGANLDRVFIHTVVRRCGRSNGAVGSGTIGWRV
jgi:hypothetical protein